MRVKWPDRCPECDALVIWGGTPDADYDCRHYSSFVGSRAPWWIILPRCVRNLIRRYYPMAFWTTYPFPLGSKLEKGMSVIVTSPPYSHPRWRRRKQLNELHYIWRVETMKNNEDVMVSRPGTGRRRRWNHVSWRWIRPAAPLEELARQAE